MIISRRSKASTLRALTRFQPMGFCTPSSPSTALNAGRTSSQAPSHNCAVLTFGQSDDLMILRPTRRRGRFADGEHIVEVGRAFCWGISSACQHDAQRRRLRRDPCPWMANRRQSRPDLHRNRGVIETRDRQVVRDIQPLPMRQRRNGRRDIVVAGENGGGPGGQAQKRLRGVQPGFETHIAISDQFGA